MCFGLLCSCCWGLGAWHRTLEMNCRADGKLQSPPAESPGALVIAAWLAERTKALPKWTLFTHWHKFQANQKQKAEIFKKDSCVCFTTIFDRMPCLSLYGHCYKGTHSFLHNLFLKEWLNLNICSSEVSFTNTFKHLLITVDTQQCILI